MHIVPVVDSVLGHMRTRIENFQTENLRSKVVITWFHAKHIWKHMGYKLCITNITTLFQVFGGLEH